MGAHVPAVAVISAGDGDEMCPMICCILVEANMVRSCRGRVSREKKEDQVGEISGLLIPTYIAHIIRHMRVEDGENIKWGCCCSLARRCM